MSCRAQRPTVSPSACTTRRKKKGATRRIYKLQHGLVYAFKPENGVDREALVIRKIYISEGMHCIMCWSTGEASPSTK